jgi:manganese/zinc/iron transport system permease protein
MMLKYNTLVVLAGVSVLGASAGMIGSFAVLRRRALTGDALSHAALPGLCVAFLILGYKNLPAMLLGALASGVLGIVIISALGRWTKVREDAAIGAVLSVLFGLGTVLSGMIQKSPSLGKKAGLESFIFGKTAGMTLADVELIAAASLVALIAVVVLYKEFLAVSFDGDFTRSLGWPVYGLDLLLMSLIAIAVVIGLPAVGVVLISALLIIPGAAARFWTDRLASLLFVAGLFGLAIGFVGASLSAWFEMLPAGPIIVLTGTGVFLFSLLFGAKRGLLARLLDQRRFERALGLRQLLEAAWEILHERPKAAAFSADDLLARKSWLPRHVHRLLAEARAADLVESVAAGRYSLTAAGQNEAIAAARGQRLWQAYLLAYPDQATSTANLASPSIEEYVSPPIVAELTAGLKAAGRWPEAPR